MAGEGQCLFVGWVKVHSREMVRGAAAGKGAVMLLFLTRSVAALSRFSGEAYRDFIRGMLPVPGSTPA
jgi:hypothetical protein